MVEFEEKTEEQLNEQENADLTGEQLETSEEGKPRTKSSKKGKAAEGREARKKKQDALDGNDSKKASGDSEGKEKGASKTSEANKGKFEGEKPKPEAGDKEKSDSGDKVKGEGSGSQSLQSGQTTVQFSSGGNAGMASSLTALLSLFGSSAALARAEVGSLLGISNQATNINTRTGVIAQVASSFSLGEVGKDVTGIVSHIVDKVIEAQNTRIIGDLNVNRVLPKTINIHDVSISGLRGPGIQNADISHEGPKISLVISEGGGFTFIEGFNIGNFFFGEGTRFVFTIKEGAYAGTIGNYFKDAGFTQLKVYEYEVISPYDVLNPPPPSNSGNKYLGGIEIVKADGIATQVSVSEAAGTYSGLTITSSGDLYATSGIKEPMSVLIKITDPDDGTTSLPIRINAGPGPEVTAHNIDPNISYTDVGKLMLGQRTDANLYTGSFLSSVLNSSVSDTIIGNGFALNMDPGQVTYNRGLNKTDASLLTVSFGTGSTEHYELPSNTIFRHVGDSLDTVPTGAAYGNFSNFYNSNLNTTTYSTLTFPGSTFSSPASSSHITMGGNVLDVFGTKYGVGDTLIVKLTSGAFADNIVTLGANTLAGFGTGYGDLQTLNVVSLSPNHSASGSTTFDFRGNVLYVDKVFDSTLFTHLENLNISNDFTGLSNLEFKFGDSVIHGNIGNDTFYGDIYKVGDAGINSFYNDFLKEVFVHDVNGIVTVTAPRVIHHPKVTTIDSHGNTHTTEAFDETVEGSNSITWGNNVYTGGADPFHPTQDQDIYHFTLLGDRSDNPIMQGHARITDFDSGEDTLVFQLTNDLFKALDTTHTKKISALDLDAGVNFVGNKIVFKGGGSITIDNINFSSFGSIPEAVITEVNTRYVAVLNQTALPIKPFVYGGEFVSEYLENNLTPPEKTSPYYNELDNFFKNSTFATYQISELTPAPSGVDIDEWGTIKVQNGTPYILPLTITATTKGKVEVEGQTDTQGNPVVEDKVDSVTDTFLFAFLKAPIINVDAGTIGYGLINKSVILTGGLDSELIGSKVGGISGIYTIPSSSHFPSASGNAFVGNLLINTEGGTGYGTFKEIIAIAQGADNQPAYIDGADTTLKLNALYINGIGYGLTEKLSISSIGGIADLDLRPGTVSINSFGQYTNNNFNFAPAVVSSEGVETARQTLYGQGTLFGIMDKLQIVSEAGTIGIVTTSENTVISQVGEAIRFDLRSIVEQNSFSFGPTAITIHGDHAAYISTEGVPIAASINTVYGNLAGLDITVEGQYTKVQASNLDIWTTADFSGIRFIFNDATLTGGAGTTTYYGHLRTFGDAFSYPSYAGFVKDPTVSIADVVVGDVTKKVMTITDQKGTPETADDNSITWGNNTYNGGTGADIYNFTIIKDVANNAVMQGFDTIHNFTPSQGDKIVLNVVTNYSVELGQTLLDTLDNRVYFVTDYDPTLDPALHPEILGPYKYNTTINFIGGGGQISISESYLSGATTLAQLFASGVLEINRIGSTPTTITLKADSGFDPVFVNVEQPFAFAQFVDKADPFSVTYTTTAEFPTAEGNSITLSPEGTLSVNLGANTPFAKMIDVTVSDGDSAHDLHFSTPILAINAADGYIHRHIESPTSASEAFGINIPGSTIIGDTDTGDIDGSADSILSFNSSTSPTTAETITFNSNLISDVSIGGHTAVGNIENIEFINPGISHNVPTLNGQIIEFNPNVFLVNAYDASKLPDAQTGGVYGNIIGLEMNATGGLDSGTPYETYIKVDSTTFSSNVLFGSGAQYGNLKFISLLIGDNPLLPEGTMVGNAHIDGNKFTFGANEITSISYDPDDFSTIYTALGTLVMENTESSLLTHNTGTVDDPTSPSSIANNEFIFKDSVLTATADGTHFYSDIADLSHTMFVLQDVTLGTAKNPDDDTDDLNHILVVDRDGNMITWGNNTFIVDLDNPVTSTDPNTFTFTLLSTTDGKAVMQGKASIDNIGSEDILEFKLSPGVFRMVNTDYNRELTVDEIENAFPTTEAKVTSLISQNLLNLNVIKSVEASLLSFSGAGSIEFLSGTTNKVEATLAYANTPITIADRTPEPIVFVSDGGLKHDGDYGNILDSYFNFIDVANAGSVYAVELSQKVHQLDLLPPNVSFLSDDGSNALFDHYGTANSSFFTGPYLGVVTVTPTDVHFSTNVADNDIHLDLLVGAFNGTVTPVVNEGVGSVILGSSVKPSYLLGTFENETLVGSLYDADLFFDEDLNVSVDPSSVMVFNVGSRIVGGGIGDTYGANKFGGNLIINTNEGNKAYGALENITFNVISTDSYEDTMPELRGNVYDFGSNAFNVNGTVYGVTDEFLMHVENNLSGVWPGDVSNTLTSLAFANVFNFGTQIMFGKGTLYGQLNSFHAAIYGNDDAQALLNGTADNLYIGAEISSNQFNFASTEIIITGTEHSTIYPHINSLSIVKQQGTAAPTMVADPGDTIDASVYFKGNAFTFEDSIAVAGVGGADFYSDINDMSSMSFWNTWLNANSDNNHVTVTDLDPTNIVNGIRWGNNDFYLSTVNESSGEEPVGVDTIHINLLGGYNPGDSNYRIIMPGNLDVYHFDPTNDYININLSSALYKAIHNALGNGTITGTVLDNFIHDFVHVPQQYSHTFTPDPPGPADPTVISTLFDFGYGKITFADSDVPTITALYNSGHLRIGTTTAGTTGVDAFSFTTGSHEFNHITQFNDTGTNQDSLNLLVPTNTYNQITQYGLLSNSEALDSFISGGIGAISITHPPAAFAQSPDVNLLDAGVDTTINFLTGENVTGSLTLHNVNIADADALNSYLSLTAQGTGASDTFYAIVSGTEDVSSYTQNLEIANFTVGQDNLQLIFSPEVFNVLTENSLLRGNALANFIEDSVNDSPTGGILLAHKNIGDETDTVLRFAIDNNKYGSITLQGVEINQLQELGVGHLQVGSLQQGTGGVDHFNYNTFDTTHFADFFPYFHHITDYNVGADKLQISLSEPFYNYLVDIGYQMDSTQTEHEALIDGFNSFVVDTPQGGVLLTHPDAQYNGAVAKDTVIQFASQQTPSDPLEVHGSITLHNVNIPSFSDFGDGLQLGVYQEGLPGSDIFDYTIKNSVSSFDRYDDIDNFSKTQDYLQILLPKTVYDSIDNGSANFATVVNNLESSASTSTGGITVTTASAAYGSGQDSTLAFKTNASPEAQGSIVLHNVDLNDDLSNLGSHLRLGSIQTGTSAAETFEFKIPGTDSFSSFHQYSKIIDFDVNGQNVDTYTLKIPQALFDAIDVQQHPIFPFGNLSVTDLENSASTALGGIHISESTAGTAVLFQATPILGGQTLTYGSVLFSGMTETHFNQIIQNNHFLIAATAA